MRVANRGVKAVKEIAKKVPSVFVSHTTKDDGFVNHLREKLGLLGVFGWTDSRQITPGAVLTPTLKAAIQEADHFLVVLSWDGVDSNWVKKEIDYALKVQKDRGQEYKIIPLLLDDVKTPVLKLLFKSEPVSISIEQGPGGLDKAMPQIAAALGLEARPEALNPPVPGSGEKPVAELIVELVRPVLSLEEGKSRVQA